MKTFLECTMAISMARITIILGSRRYRVRRHTLVEMGPKGTGISININWLINTELRDRSQVAGLLLYTVKKI